MSSDNKTEKPTPKRIADARQKGQVAKSQDFNGAMVLTAAGAAFAFAGPYAFSTLYSMMQYTFTHLPKQALTITSFTALLSDVVFSIIWLLLPFLLTVMVMGTMSNLIQVKPLFAPQALMPKLDKINPLNGFKRMFSMRSWVEVIKAIVKMGVIGAASFWIIQGHMSELMSVRMMTVSQAWGVILEVISQIVGWSCTLFFILGMIDWRYQAYEMEKQLRMSRQDIKDERKNQEGDPMIKNRIRQTGIQMAKKRQLAAVPMADVVITNPTHFAIAIKYDPELAPAPVVVAKGKDHFALKIKECAKENGVPTVENKPLARALYAAVEVDAMISPDLFLLVAEVLAYVYSTNKGRKLAAARKRQKAAASHGGLAE